MEEIELLTFMPKLLEETETYRAEESRLSCQIEFSDELDGMKFTIAPEE